MAKLGTGWWRQHGWTVAILLAAFALAMTVRSLFAWPIFAQNGWLYIYAGGSDSYYHSRVMQYIIMNHTNLIRDYALRYPTGAINPREPLFDWMNAVLGILFQGFFPGATSLDRAQQAGAFFLDLQAPLWAGIGVFPIYLIGKEVGSRRTGLVAALLYPFIVANIDSSGLGYANYLTFYTAVILFVAYAYLRTVKATTRRRWVASYRHPRQILAGLRDFWTYERTAVKWAVFTGVMFGILCLAWQGFPFLIAILVVFLVVQFLIERIRHQDSFGLYLVTLIVGVVGFTMAAPYYIVQTLFVSWFYAPLLLFFGVLALLLPFLLLRDYPWVVSVPVFIAALLAGAAAFYLVDPATFNSVITGQGYFVKTLVYTTVAEAQAPSVDSLILGYGVITFFLAFAGLLLIGIRIVRQRFRRDLVFFFAFCIVSIYLPLTAAKFFLVGSPVYALLPAEVLVLLLDVAGYPTLRRNLASLADTRGKASAFRRSFKARHVAVMAVVLVILVPNVWYAIDAGIPGNTKGAFNVQVYNTLPPPLRTSPSNASSYYLGAAGTSLDTPNQYDEAGYNWLATQDTNLPMYQRPAFISWWDYGFQAIDEGLHPSVADNFQNGIDPAGNFLLSQNESQAIAILAVELLAAEQTTSHQPYLPSALNAILAHDGVNLRSLHNLMVNTSADVPLVIANPQRYLPVDAGNLDPTNAMYDATSWFLGDTLSLAGVSQVYDDVQAYTGWAIRYAMVDSRLFPFSGSNTGIFYAPADLTDRVISAGGVPTTYYQVTVLGSDGNTYTAGSLPPGVQAAANPNIAYSSAFFNTMLYHIYIGYNGSDVGQSACIPGISCTSSDPVEPGWMLQHFQVVYRTAYYSPSANAQECAGTATNLPQSVALAKAQNGTASTEATCYFSGGETMLEYYAGEPLVGSVELPSGTPVSSVYATVYDGWGIPHMTDLTGANGTFSLILPPGNDTVNITTGTFTPLSQSGVKNLASLHIYVPPQVGFANHAPPLVDNVVLAPTTVSGFVYFNDANNSSYQPASDRLAVGATLTLSGSGLPTYTATTDASGSYAIGGITPGVYNWGIRYEGANFPQSNAIDAYTGSTVNETVGLSPGSLSGYVHEAANLTRGIAGATVRLSGPNGTLESTITDISGLFTLNDIVPGNYTVRASIAGTNLVSPAVPEVFTAAGGKAKVNLTVVPTIAVRLGVLANGAPTAGVSVRFTEILPPTATVAGNNTTAAANAGINSTVAVTGADGSLTVLLPAGNYSVYAASLVGPSWYAGLASAYVPRTTGSVLTLPPFTLSPAVQLSANVLAPANSPTANLFGTTLVAYNAHGDGALGLLNQSGQDLLYLPPGRYAVEASAPAATGTPGGTAALAQVNLTYSTTLSLRLVSAFDWKPQAGAHLGSSPSLYAAGGAEVNVSTGPGTVPISVVADANGSAELLLPNSLPTGESYCIGASDVGFRPYYQCGLSPAAVSGTVTLPLNLATVGVNLSLTGVPSGTRVHVNLSASAPPAQSTTLYGGPNFGLALFPGEYQLTAWAPYGNGSGVYQTAQPLNFTLRPGVAGPSIALPLRHELASAGTLDLPPAVNASLVEVRLSSSTLNLSVDGSAFRTHFLAAPGTYVAYATAPVGNASYANLTTVTISSKGVVSPSISLLGTGTTLIGTLVPPSGYELNNSSLPVTLVGPQGLTVSATAVDGSFTAILPSGGSYRVYSTATITRLVLTGGLEFVTFSAGAGSVCTLSGSTTPCSIPVTATVGLSSVVGSAVGAGSSIRPDGTVTFLTASGSRSSTPLTDGQFTTRLLPGTYTVYATGTGASTMLAALTNVSVGNGTAYLNLSMGAAYTDTLTLLAAVGGPPSANLSVSRVGFPVLRLVDEPMGTAIPLTLPAGTWSLAASSTANAYGVRTASAAHASVALLAGNAATTLALSAILTSTVSITPTGQLSATVPPGGTVRFTYSLINTGSTPVSFHLLGSPVTWNITFLPRNFTLNPGPGGTSSSVAVVVLPAGTPVAHPPFIVEAIESNGTLLGASSLSPTLNVEPEPALSIGANAKLSSIASDSITVPFWAYNSGNLAETVNFAVGDVARLSGLGWITSLRSGTSPITAPVSLSAGQNASYSVVLSASGGHALPPGSVTVLASVVNGSNSLERTAELPVPTLTVGLSNGTIAVTGPSIGSPPAYPDWLVPVLVFVPAIAFLVGAVSWRWWRTRRWVRR